MPLTNLKVQKAKPQAKQYKLADERGMYLLIHPKGGKYWRLDYRFEGRPKTLAIGTHPETSLKQARKKRDRARSDIEDGIDQPGQGFSGSNGITVNNLSERLSLTVSD